MPCEQYRPRGGGTLWMCSTQRVATICSVCKRRKATLLCDHPADGGTCDAPLCKRCAVHIGNVDARPDLSDPLVRFAIEVTTRSPKGRTARQKRTHEAVRDLAKMHMMTPDTVDWCPSHQTGPSR